MDLEDSGIDSDPKNHSTLHISVPEPIITFSPDRCRFETGKSRNSSITSDFEVTSPLEVAYSSQVAEPSSLSDLLTNCGGGGGNSNSSPGDPPPPLHNNINSSRTRNGSTCTTFQLHKRLEKQIAQAAMATHTKDDAKSDEETEFGEWNTHQNPNLNHNNNNQNNSNELEPESTLDTPNITSNTFQEFEVDEVEVITKCSRRMSTSGYDVRKQSGLIPPERLAIPHKGQTNSNRKHSAKSNSDSKQPKKQITNNPTQPDGANPPGSTSENKPLVQWDSDESEDELSFYPAAKTRAKLTDNLSIDNMSLSGEEDDLHLSPPRPLTRKCPCDPRPWLQDHLPKSPSNGSPPCCIT